MKPRDRVRAALGREEPDRCPMAIDATPEFKDRLLREPRMQELVRAAGARNTREFERALGQDMLLTSAGRADSRLRAGDDFTDEWGVAWKRAPGETDHPLSEDSAIESYAPPDPARPELYQDAAQTIRDFKGEYWIVGAIMSAIFERAWALRGLDRLLMDLVIDPELADHILDIPFRYHLSAARRLAQMGVDMILIGDDVGTRQAPLLSPPMWRRHLKPRMARLIAEVKAANPAVKVAYHSDGNIESLIPELIEIGLDALHLVLPACMDPAALKKLYGTRLCFWGSIDGLRTLPSGKPAEVRDEVLLRLRTLGKGGGLILGPTHPVRPDTPMENFWTMVDTIAGTPYSSLR